MLLFGFEKLDYFIFPIHEGTIFLFFFGGGVYVGKG
jgi:hypothetical protein